MPDVVQSPAAKRNAEITAQVVSDQQHILRATLCGGDKAKLTWLYEAPGVTTKLASDLLKVLLSGDNANEDETYQWGDAFTNAHYDRFVGRARDAQIAECPAQQAASRKWAAKWVKLLDEQASLESDAIRKLLTASAANPRRLFSGEDEDDSEPAKKKLTESEELLRLQKCAAMQKGDSGGYFKYPPSLRLADKMIKHIQEIQNGSILPPDWETLVKGGLAGPLLIGYDKGTSLLIGLLQMLFIVHRFKPPSNVVYGTHDESSPKFVEETIVDGVTKEVKKTVYCSPAAVLDLTRKIEYPLRMVKDLTEREALCKRFYNELVSSLNQIDCRTMTAVFSDLCGASMALGDAMSSVQRAYSESGKSSKRDYGASTSSGSSSSRTRSTSSSSSQPSNACIRWLRGDKCRKTDPSIEFDCSKFDHIPGDKGKYPDAVFPQKKKK